MHMITRVIKTFLHWKVAKIIGELCVRECMEE